MKRLFLIVIMLFLCGCTSSNENPKKDNSLTKIQQIIDSGDYIVLDVRTKEEYDVSHVVGAINIPLNEINEEIALDKTKKILVYCQSGGRSTSAASLLESMGYTVYNMGGIGEVPLPVE